MWIDPSQISFLTAVGLWFDILGAVLLAKAFATATDRALALAFDVGTYQDFNPPALKALCEQRIDAKFGLALLLTGFFLQLLSSLGVMVHTVAGLMLAALTIPAAIFYETKRYYWTMKAYVRITAGINPGWIPNNALRQRLFPDVPPAELARAVGEFHGKQPEP